MKNLKAVSKVLPRAIFKPSCGGRWVLIFILATSRGPENAMGSCTENMVLLLNAFAPQMPSLEVAFVPVSLEQSTHPVTFQHGQDRLRQGPWLPMLGQIPRQLVLRDRGLVLPTGSPSPQGWRISSPKNHRREEQASRSFSHSVISQRHQGDSEPGQVLASCPD